MRHNQIEAWKAKTRRDETECETIVLTSDSNRYRPRIPSTMERRKKAIEEERSDFVSFVQPRLTNAKISISRLSAKGKEVGVGFVAVDAIDRYKKIVRSYFFGPKGY